MSHTPEQTYDEQFTINDTIDEMDDDSRAHGVDEDNENERKV